MRVAVIGGGSIGLLFSCYLSKSADELTLYVRRSEQADSLERDGLELLHKGVTETFEIESHPLDEVDTIDADLVVVAVKQYDLPNIKSKIHKVVNKNAKLLFVQNGMSHVDLVESLPHKEIFLGVVEHGAYKCGDHQVEHTGEGVLKIAAFRGHTDATDPFWNQLTTTRFPIEMRESWYEMLAEKLIVNAVINPLTAIYRVENGVLVSRDGFRRNMRRLFEEAISVLGLNHVDTHWDNVLNVCRKTAKNRSSMLKDIELGRQTEIDAISGYLLSRARDNNGSLPFTTFVYDSVVGLSEGGRNDLEM